MKNKGEGMKNQKKLGRPSKYDPAMCDTVMELMSTGASKTEVAAKLEIARDTLTVWQSDNPEFSAAIKRGEELSQAWWEKIGREATQGHIDGFNATAWIFNMKNRFRWRDVQEQQQRFVDKDGNDVQKITKTDQEIIDRYMAQRSIEENKGKGV